MDEKRLTEIEVILDECETTNELRRVMGSTGPLRELVAEIRRLRHVLERVKAVWEDVHDETSIVGIIDNALGLNELTEEELLLIWESENIPLEDRFK